MTDCTHDNKAARETGTPPDGWQREWCLLCGATIRLTGRRTPRAAKTPPDIRTKRT